MSTEADAIREEVVALQGLIDGLPERHRDGALGRSYRGRLDQLQRALADANLTAISERLSTPGLSLRIEGQASRIKAVALAELVAAIQTLMTALGQAVTGKPTTRGMVPVEVQRRTALEAVAFAPGSFIVQLVVSPSALEPSSPQLSISQFDPTAPHELAFRALGELSALLEVEDDETKLRASFARLKGRVLAAYDNLLLVPEKNGVALELSYHDPRSRKRWSRRVPTERASSIRSALRAEADRERAEPEFVAGVLVGANDRSGSFEVVLDDGSSLQGRTAEASLLRGVTIGQTYTFELRQVISKDPLTGASSMSYELGGKPERV